MASTYIWHQSLNGSWGVDAPTPVGRKASPEEILAPMGVMRLKRVLLLASLAAFGLTAGGTPAAYAADCYAIGLRLAKDKGGQLARATPSEQDGKQICRVVVLIPGQDGARPRRVEYIVPAEEG